MHTSVLPSLPWERCGANGGVQGPILSLLRYLFGARGLHAGSCQPKPERLTALDEAPQPLVLDSLAQLRGVEGHNEGDIHPWADVTLRGADGKMRLEALHVPHKPCRGKHKDRKEGLATGSCEGSVSLSVSL